MQLFGVLVTSCWSLRSVVTSQVAPWNWGVPLRTAAASWSGWHGVQCRHVIPSGELTFCHGKSPFLMGKSTISMAIFHCFLYVHQRVTIKAATSMITFEWSHIYNKKPCHNGATQAIFRSAMQVREPPFHPIFVSEYAGKNCNLQDQKMIRQWIEWDCSLKFQPNLIWSVLLIVINPFESIVDRIINGLWDHYCYQSISNPLNNNKMHQPITQCCYTVIIP